ncbi:MAG: PAS-domain containing protein, partial [Alphaproteobacteria bacterium]|nr:PAS-domain containing protein [Alphaproteobacteria bacterium]
MPKMSGLQVLQTLRELQRSVPVIVITAYGSEEVVVRALRLGANDYVAKPFETQALIARIETHIARLRAETALKQSQDQLERRVEQRTAELRRANRELEDARNILTDALEAITDGFVLWDANDALAACNQRYKEFFGRNADAVIPGAKFENLLRMQAEGGALRGALGRSEAWLEQRLARHRNPAGSFEEEFSDGTWARMSETRASNGRTVGLCTDITDIKRREIALKTFAETNRRLAAAVNATESAILITDPARHGNPTVFANPAFSTMTGWPVEEALGRDRKMLAGADTDKAEVGRLEKSMRDGVAASAELWLYSRDGRPFRAEINASPIRNNSGEVVNWVIIQTDITNRKETEEQLHQSQKMEAIGQLAGGVAHDFNNLLTVILSNAELLLRGLGTEDPRREELTDVREAAQRAAALTRQLLAFSRKQVLKPRVLNLNDVVVNIEKMLGRLIGEDVELVTMLEPELWSVEADPGQIEQIIMNLAVNARDAMPEGGRLSIETGNVDVDENFARSHYPIFPGSYGMLVVCDTGEGMDTETRSRIFEPFFT